MAAEIQPANPAHTNRLAREKSPYLLQHAHNPVDWYPWGEEAFAKARRENKPIFLSIGYSTCHWCHVMAHESFENEETAAIMNREFVNIKVDREERPDVDRVYMTFVQATTGGGGWPMSVWLTPDLKPFVGGTYFPPVDRYGQPGFTKMLERIAAAWKQGHEKIAEQGSKIVEALRESQNAQPASAYLDAFQITRDPQYADVARDILDYVARDMISKNGGFFSAEDADSLFEHGKPEHGEGAFYVWTEKQVDAALGDDSSAFKFYYGVQPHGKAPEGSDPQDEFRGKNILIGRHTIAETAKHFKKSENEARQSLARSREKLLSIRNKRPRPHLDDKIIAAWNGLMISAYARAAQILDEPRYLESATRAAKFLRSNLYDEKSKLLYRNYREGRSEIEGFADDYAFVIQGLTDLYEASFDVEWLKFAVELQETQDRLFFDEKNGGYFSTTGQESSVPLRMKDDNDSAEPAASSIAAINLLRLAQFRDDKELEERARKTIDAFAPTLSHFASAMPQMLVALDYSLGKPRQIVIAGKKDSPETKALLAEVRRHFLPKMILLLADTAEGQKYLGEKNEAIRAMSMVAGKAAAYVCENFACKAPVTDVDEFRDLLTS